MGAGALGLTAGIVAAAARGLRLAFLGGIPEGGT